MATADDQLKIFLNKTPFNTEAANMEELINITKYTRLLNYFHHIYSLDPNENETIS